MYKLQFTLKQHTPLIHFQHDQEGATLRATEVKPKLDRFIYQKWLAEENGSEEAVFRKYGHLTVGFSETKMIEEVRKYDRLNQTKKAEYIDNFIWALDYKILINNADKIKSEKIYYSTTRDGKFKPHYPNIFGNVELESEKKVFRIIEGGFHLNILTLKTQIKQVIDQNIEAFFFSTNFGFRQSKGFGSFLIENKYELKGCPFFFDITVNNAAHKEIFKQIELLYKCFKSGINLKDDNTKDKMYFKSLMFSYAKNLDVSEQWDKRTIRHSLYLSDWKYKNPNPNDDSGVLQKRVNPESTVQFKTNLGKDQKYYFDFRDLLGLSTEQDWLFYRDKRINKVVTKTVIIDGIRKELEIERFQSPLLFKPVYIDTLKRWRIYIIPQDIPEIYKGAIVEVKNNSKSVKLEIYPDFKLDKFISESIDRFNQNDIEFGNGYNINNVEEARIIVNIFQSLKTNLTNHS